MKKVVSRILICSIGLLFCGCNKSNSETALPLEKAEAIPASVAPAIDPEPWHWDTNLIHNIDGCKYVQWYMSIGGFVYLHLPSCTNCQAKLEKTIDERLAKMIIIQKPIVLATNSFDGFNKVFTVNGCQYAQCFGDSSSYTHLGSCTNCSAKLEKTLDERFAKLEALIKANAFKQNVTVNYK